MDRAEALFVQMKRPLIVAFPDREWEGSADTAFAERSGAGSGTKARCPQTADFVGNVSARRGEVGKMIQLEGR